MKSLSKILSGFSTLFDLIFFPSTVKALENDQKNHVFLFRKNLRLGMPKKPLDFPGNHWGNKSGIFIQKLSMQMLLDKATGCFFIFLLCLPQISCNWRQCVKNSSLYIVKSLFNQQIILILRNGCGSLCTMYTNYMHYL